MQPRRACVKTLCSSKERNRDRILNERAEREKYNGACAPDSEKCRAHRCSRDRRSPLACGIISFQPGIIDPGYDCKFWPGLRAKCRCNEMPPQFLIQHRAFHRVL